MTSKTGSLVDHQVLVTGAGGYIGSALIPRLINEGAWVIGIDLRKPSKDFEKFSSSSFTFVEGEFAKLGQKLVTHSLRKTPVRSCVIHLAGISSVNQCNEHPYKAFLSNVALTVQALEFCRKQNIERFIFPSTGLVYGNKRMKPAKEDSQENPENIYAWTKLAAEKMVLAYSEKYNIKGFMGRISNIYGRFVKNGTIISDIVEQVHKRSAEVVIKDGNPVRDFIFVNDVVAALVSFISLKSDNETEVYNISSNSGTSILKLSETICELSGVPRQRVKSLKAIGGIASTLILDNTKLMKTGWRPKYSLDDGLRTMNVTSCGDE